MIPHLPQTPIITKCTYIKSVTYILVYSRPSIATANVGQIA